MRLLVSIPDIRADGKDEQPLHWNSLQAALGHTLRAIRRRHDSFELDEVNKALIESAFKQLNERDSITNGPSRSTSNPNIFNFFSYAHRLQRSSGLQHELIYV